ncbi:MAG: glycine cleavage system protein H [Chloroflexi bacterium]|nr:glycine cleavage system protein H [Chloroflexota bacterium]
MKFNFPQECYYDRANHLWVKLTAPAQALAGIDALGLEALGDLAYLALPEIGAQVTRAKAMGTLEAAKMTGELIAPISGTVVARNERVLRDPSLVNRDNYGDGWLVAISASDWTAESADLVYGDQVAAWAEQEIERYRSQGWIND